jgi:fission process protein 1
MALPAFTIHTAVKMATKRLATSPNPALKRWAPTAVGLGIVPALPYLFDEPVGFQSFGEIFESRRELMR